MYVQGLSTLTLHVEYGTQTFVKVVAALHKWQQKIFLEQKTQWSTMTVVLQMNNTY